MRTQEQEHLDLLTYNEELTFEWKGKQVVCSSYMESCCSVLSPGLEAPPAPGPGDHARDVDGNRCASALGGVQSRKG